MKYLGSFFIIASILSGCLNDSAIEKEKISKQQQIIEQKNKELELREKEFQLKEAELELLKSQIQNKTEKKTLHELYEEIKKSVYLIYTKKDESILQGTAFVISSDGIAVSNFHVFENASEAIAINESGQKFIITEIINYSYEKDFIIFRIGPITSPIPFLNVAKDLSKIGEECFTIGNPEGLSLTISKGLISSYRENQELIQTTTEITHGSSGGPLLNLDGEVIGITTSGLNKADLNFAVNINQLNLNRYFKNDEVEVIDTYIPEEKIISIIKQYYNHLSNDNYQNLGNLYEDTLNRYYNKFDISKKEVIDLAVSYKEKYRLLYTKHMVNWNTLQINKSKNIYVINFKMNYEVLRKDKNKPSKFNLSIVIEMNSNYKIQSIYENIISKD